MHGNADGALYCAISNSSLDIDELADGRFLHEDGSLPFAEEMTLVGHGLIYSVYFYCTYRPIGARILVRGIES